MEVLSIEKMKHLHELGLNINDASMSYIEHDNLDRGWYYELVNIPFEYECSDYPAYTLDDVLKKLPKFINTSRWCLMPYADSTYVCEYSGVAYRTQGDTMIDAAYNMLVKLIELNYIKLNKQ